MLKKILIANRGEIACRIIRTAKRLDVATVAVYSDADAKAMHVEQADEAVHIGPSPAPDSYLRGDKIIAAAKATGADGIHPGYGFLSENADFADAVAKAGLKFIGPSAAAMRALGGKAAAKEIAIKAGVPVVPGYQGDKQDAKSLAAEARKIGYPVMIKAVAGGGGRGMRLVANEEELPELLASAQREAEGAFGNAHVLIEKVVERPRHIEVQVFGDAKGNVVHIFERDCTLQRRNQKVVEEAPAPGMTPVLREKMCAAAVKLAKQVGYEGAGTVEFLVEGGSLGADAKWYFIEMNTRLQVEHPVTEEITGLDLVEWQLRVASGEKLPLEQSAIKMSGHAIEVRLCAEDPAKGFLPSIGRIGVFEHASFSAGTRLETGIRAGDQVSPFYDSMVAKLITHGRDRSEAVAKNIDGMQKLLIGGLRVNTRFLINLLERAETCASAFDTGLIAREMNSLREQSVAITAVESACRTYVREAGQSPDFLGSPWRINDAFVLGEVGARTRRLAIDGVDRTISVKWVSKHKLFEGQTWPDVEIEPWSDLIPSGVASQFPVRVSDGIVYAFDRGMAIAVSIPIYDASAIDDGGSGDAVRAPINGKVARIFIKEGDTVAKGDRIAIVEAMKMEHVLHAAREGLIAKVAAVEGQQVNQGALIATLAEV